MKCMKKIISLVLGLVMILSLSMAAFAEEETVYQDMSTVTLHKTYKLTNTGTISPAETFTFSALTLSGIENGGVGAANAPLPTIASVAYSEGEAGSGTATKDITISLPDYPAVGIYTYTFNEIDGDTAGVTYRSDAITLKVTVIEQNGKTRVAAVHTEGNGGTKSDTFENVYSAGSLAVKKVVAGNMGDQNKEFNVTVTFTAPEGDTVRSTISYTDGDTPGTVTFDGNQGTAQITLKHNETVTFTNIPYGVTYTVTESEANEDGYTTTYDGANGTINAASQSTTITNTKGAEVDTGIYTDSLPYILILALVAAAAFVFFSRKHFVKD